MVIKKFEGYEVVRRPYDNAYVVYALRPWPDETLDNDPAALKAWLTNTKGWRAHGWMPVYVSTSSRDATRWAWKQAYGNKEMPDAGSHD